MEENQKEKHIVAILIMVLLLAIAGCISYLLLNNKGDEKSSNKSDTTQSKYEKIDSTKGIYYVQKGNEYKFADNLEENETDSVSFSYPVINSKDESVSKVNSEIKNLYAKREKEVLYAPLENDDCTCIIINGKKQCGRSVNAYKYEALETKLILNIKISDLGIKLCGSGSLELSKSYFVSKTTGKILTNSEILKEFKYSEDNLIKAYNLYLNKLKTRHPGVFDEYKAITKVDELTFILIKDDDNNIKLGVIGPGYSNGTKFELGFDGSVITGVDADADNGVLKS